MPYPLLLCQSIWAHQLLASLLFQGFVLRINPINLGTVGQPEGGSVYEKPRSGPSLSHPTARCRTLSFCLLTPSFYPYPFLLSLPPPPVLTPSFHHNIFGPTNRCRARALSGSKVVGVVPRIERTNFYLTERVYKVVLQNSIPTQIRQLILHCY